MRWFVVLFLAAGTAACAAPVPPPLPGPAVPVAEAVPGAATGAVPGAVPGGATLETGRPVLYPLVRPPEYEAAVEAGTRAPDGSPGAAYWQQQVDYRIRARVDTEARSLVGSQVVRYHNRSPDALPVLVLNLTQNYHAEGVERVRPAEVTGGKEIHRVSVGGRALEETVAGRVAGWQVDGTLMYVVLPQAVAPGGMVELEVDWSFVLPQSGAGGRMGYSGETLLYLGYWFPQLAVYDDVFGWHAEPFRGQAEFYSNFGRYDLTLDVPAGWLVMSTGRLANPESVLRPAVLERLRQAETSDEVVRVVSHADAARATLGAPGDRLEWRFVGDSVRDVAFAVMRDYAWDAVRAPVGDRTGDGQVDHTRVDAFWRAHATHYPRAAEYGRHAVEFFSTFTGLPYAWPQMSVVEGGGIIGGGMEYPMITIIGDYNHRGAAALQSVIAHEIAHMWLPMMLSTNERRYGWLDEGTTVFAENFARMDRFPGRNPFLDDQYSYVQAALAGLEGPILRWSDFHYPGPAYGVASYPKPAAVLYALMGVLGEETFMAAYREFHRRWVFRHPYPWDLWSTFEDVSGLDLGWFWRAWYLESTEDGGEWWLDQAVESVERLAGGETRVVVRDQGWIPMPVHLTATRQDGTVVQAVEPVERWLEGADRVEIVLPAGARVVRVEIDAAQHFPDVDRRNNVWTGR
jgi:hypothetical protein